MMQSWMFLAIEGLVAILLSMTIVYCVILNKKLKALKKDEAALRSTMIELFTVTDGAEKAIGHLKQTVGEYDRTLAHKIDEAKDILTGLDTRIQQGDVVLHNIGQIVKQSVQPKAPAPVQEAAKPRDPAQTAALAKALATRLQALSRGEAA